jgi:flagellar biosynthesis/type III secretory pathway protein FliH
LFEIQPSLLDFINTKEQQEYEDGLEKGYQDGQENQQRK